MKGSRKLVNHITSLTPVLIAATLLALMVYGAAQHILRIGANDPQIQLAEDLADKLANNTEPKSLADFQEVDIAKSLAPFLIIYDPMGKVLASSGTLNNKTPMLPDGILQIVDQKGEYRFTWQPQPGVRIATVITKIDGGSLGYVLAGRSLREVEALEKDLLNKVIIGWIITILAILIAPGILKKFSKELEKEL